MSGIVLEPTERKCAARYCRAKALATMKYCSKHMEMTGGEIIKEGHEEKETIKLTKKTIALLVNYALEDLAKKLDP
jgi:hypothetical protein